MFNNRFRKYFRYAQMMSFIFETIIVFSAAIKNVYAQLVLIKRELTTTYIMLIWMLLWDPLTYLFHWGTRVLVIIIIILRSAWRSQQTFLFLFCFFFFFYYSFLFFSTATCVLWFLNLFSTNLDEIWHVDSPWWDEQTEYFFKSIGPGVRLWRGPKVLLCFMIGKTLYTVRRDKNFT